MNKDSTKIQTKLKKDQNLNSSGESFDCNKPKIMSSSCDSGTSSDEQESSDSLNS